MIKGKLSFTYLNYCLNISNEQLEFEILNNTIYINTPQDEILRYKFFKKYLPKLHEENHKSLMKEI